MIDSIKEVERLTAVIREGLAERVRTALILGLDGSARSLCHEVEELKKWTDSVSTTLDALNAEIIETNGE